MHWHLFLLVGWELLVWHWSAFLALWLSQNVVTFQPVWLCLQYFCSGFGIFDLGVVNDSCTHHLYYCTVYTNGLYSWTIPGVSLASGLSMKPLQFLELPWIPYSVKNLSWNSIFSNWRLSRAMTTNKKCYCKSDDAPRNIQEYPKLCFFTQDNCPPPNEQDNPHM